MVAAVVVAVLGVGGYFAYQTWIAGGEASANPTSEPTEDPEPTNEPTKTEEPTKEPPPPEPEGVEAVRIGIEEQGLECYDTLSEPAPTVTCYGIIDNASSMTLAFQHVDDEVTVLRLDASISPTSPGPSVDAYSRVAEAVAEVVLEGDGVPLITEGEREADVPWGHVRQNVAGNAAAIVFTKDGAEPARANSRPLQPGVEALRAQLGDQGFDCTPERCQRVTGEGPAAVTVSADLTTHNVRIEFILGEGAEPLPEEEVTELLLSITDAVIPESSGDVRDWFEAHKQPQLQRADFDGVRISLLWNEGADPAMTLASASAWPYEG